MGQTPCNSAEECVTRVVSIQIVQRFEAIKIKIKHCHRWDANSVVCQSKTETFEKISAIRQRGQIVVKGQIARTLLSCLNGQQLLPRLDQQRSQSRNFQPQVILAGLELAYGTRIEGALAPSPLHLDLFMPFGKRDCLCRGALRRDDP